MSLCKCNAACYTQVQHVTAVFRDCQLQLNKLFKYIADLKQWLSLTCGSWVCLPAPTAMCVCLCVCVCPSCTLASCSLPSNLRPHTPVSGPARSPPDDQGLGCGAHPTQRLRQSLWDSSSVMFAAAWSRVLTQGNYPVSWAWYEYCPLIVLLWKSISFLTLKRRNKFSSFF